VYSTDGAFIALSRETFGSAGILRRMSERDAVLVRDRQAALEDIREVIENKSARMLPRNPLRMDYYKKHQEIIAAYNREKDRAAVEPTFA
jgi:type I restriction enzyme R subunit